VIRWRTLLAVALTAVLSGPQAYALCIYNGQLYAKTTLAQEFRDSHWVIRATVVAARDHRSDDDYGSWTLYRLKVRQAFKGRPPAYVNFMTPRNSGGFYLDRGVKHDIGGDYLLFLDPHEPASGDPPEARGAMEINYSCGRSGLWKQVGARKIRTLMRLAGAARGS
jgi:hypothetical protein